MNLMTIRHEKGLCFSIQVRGHRFLMDMPREAKGGDRGPSPADFLAAALGGCMGMHMLLYGQTSGLSCEGMEMNLVYNIVEEKGQKRIGAVTVDVSLPQDPGAREAAFLRAAQHCIIRNSLTKAPEIDIAITGGDGQGRNF
ncbi:MAG: hypothetical protein FJ117_00820 [Deltaproteobacteria bacterium]|nr:hypothetical protein [Deltaproteobacteria bacterium]